MKFIYLMINFKQIQSIKIIKIIINYFLISILNYKNMFYTKKKFDKIRYDFFINKIKFKYVLKKNYIKHYLTKSRKLIIKNIIL